MNRIEQIADAVETAQEADTKATLRAEGATVIINRRLDA